MMAGVFGDLADALKNFSEMLKIMGIDVVNIIINIVAGIISFLIAFFFLISLAYFAITLSSTALQNNKIKPLHACTEKELRFGHNIEKLFRAGAFEV